MQDAWRAYLELAMGLTEAPRKKAQDVVRRLVGSGGTSAAQLQALGEELVSTGMANRDALTKLVRFEVDRALGRVGLATAEEVAELTRRVQDLERQLREARSAAAGAAPGVTTDRTAAAAPGNPPHTPAPVTATQDSGASAGGPAAPTGPVPSEGSLSAPVATPPAKKAVAKKAVAKKAVAKKAEPGKAVARRSPGTVSPTGGDAEPAHPPKKAVRKQPPGGAE
ncbi:hypothetical protein E1211_30080 [Micromonospora sp. 15K316]|uniref:phasin family protein n=1 Tax=Micromonospora sp. 15K316 TaxID=2530376 RepID=UPI001053C2E6|nr:hypothetical protein [Micromonospora sp. 15K316]TDC26529.1 hypothetical protein E1211_30080 [Micromonospora sp. 15K316]